MDWFSAAHGRRFIFVSTPGVQGFGYRLAGENVPFNPRGLYEKSKVLAEKAILSHRFKANQYWTIIRPDFVYGPGDLRRILLYRKIKAGRWPRVGSGRSVLRPTFVLDVCRAIHACLSNPASYNEIFNVAGPALITTQYYAETIAKLLGVKLLSLTLPVNLLKIVAIGCEALAGLIGTKPMVTRSQVEFLTEDHGTDIAKIKNALGFAPQFSFEDGMRQTLAWAIANKLL